MVGLYTNRQQHLSVSHLDKKAWWCLMVSSSYVDESLRFRGSCFFGSSGPEQRGMSMLLRLRWRLLSREGETLFMMIPGERRSVSWDTEGKKQGHSYRGRRIRVSSLPPWTKMVNKVQVTPGKELRRIPVHWWRCPACCCFGFLTRSQSCCTERQMPGCHQHSPQ